jgi:hypothetical protein
MAVDQRPTRTGPVGKPGQPLVLEAAALAADRVRMPPDQPGDLAVGQGVGGQQDYPRASDVALWGGVGADAPLLLGAFAIGQDQRRQGRHRCLP